VLDRYDHVRIHVLDRQWRNDTHQCIKFLHIGRRYSRSKRDAQPSIS
jgi:hypothetical protein